jgi:hypothetical protein
MSLYKIGATLAITHQKAVPWNAPDLKLLAVSLPAASGVMAMGAVL